MGVISALLVLIGALSFLGIATSHIKTATDTPSIMKHDGGQSPTFHGKADIPQNPDAALEELRIKVKQGTTLFGVFEDQGIENCEAYEVISALRKVYDPRDLRPGQDVIVTVDRIPPGNEKRHLARVRLRVDTGHDIVITRNDSNDYDVKEIERKLTVEYSQASGIIDSSLYESAVQANLPLSVMMQMMRPFSFDVDFQRDIHPGDSFEVLYERHRDENGTVVCEGPVLYSSLTLQNTTLKVYRHTTAAGTPDYYNESGQTVRKTLLKTPIDGARLTSRYGMRKHPILGYSRMHRGLDFAAPLGTPIMASGSGTVVCLGRKGDYGKYIRLRHANGYATAYAHLHRYKKGIRRGSRITQGEIIGYVGNTGLSTGPHLHYEVHYRGKKINPAKVKFPPGHTLAGKEFDRFTNTKFALERQFADLKIENIIARK